MHDVDDTHKSKNGGPKPKRRVVYILDEKRLKKNSVEMPGNE